MRLLKGVLIFTGAWMSIFRVPATAAAPPLPPGSVKLPVPPARSPDGKRLELKPYVPPTIEAEPPLSESDTPVVQVPLDEEASVVIRPGPGMPMIGSAIPGARLKVRGVWDAPTGRRCSSKRWYAVEPFGWVCSQWIRKSTDAPSTEPVLKVPSGEILPYDYRMVGVKDEEWVPLWATVDDMKGEFDPVFKLKKGDTVAVKREPPLKWNGTSYLVGEDGRVLPEKPTFHPKVVSDWQGLFLDDKTPLPFGWITPATASVYDGPMATSAVIEKLPRRSKVAILEDSGEGSKRRVRIGEGRWMRASDLNEVRLTPKPEGATTNDQWIDVDLAEQILIAYQKDRPIYATLVSSGRKFTTPRGLYPIWGKVSQITMKSQSYEDETYYVDRVPWVLFFQAHNALHGAYWHDRFGVTKSHGCVNLPPRDARWIFEWIGPQLPAAWSGLRTPNLTEGVTVQVRDSSKKRPLEQERAWGPPDREEEGKKLEEAEARRLAAAAIASPAAVPFAPTAAPTAPAAILAAPVAPAIVPVVPTVPVRP